jgi:LysR family hydrogen peroxide-inducible transcriptional activator
MELQAIRYCVILAQTLNFRKAAEQANVTQPALSQRIKNLEEELGVRLFERTPHRVALTEAGHRFLPRALAILDQIRLAKDEAKSGIKEPTGTIRVGVIPTICPYLMPQVIQWLKGKYPRLTLWIEEEITSVLIQHLKRGDLDMGILSLPIKEPNLVCLRFAEEPIRMVVGRRHRLANVRKVHLKDLSNEKFLVLQEGHCFRNQTLAYCKRQPDDPNIVFQGASLHSVIELAACGIGIAFIPKMAISEVPKDRVKILRFSDPEPTRQLGMVWRVSAPFAPSQQAVAKGIKAVWRLRMNVR